MQNEKVKTKVRFTSLDVAAMVAELQALVGLRATNIYDLNPSTYVIKFSKGQEKHQLLIENGVRFHLTTEKPDKRNIPSGFTMKFRKFLRSKRLESIRQVGVERVVVLSFGNEAFANHLILELYSQGNIILTDLNFRIIQCIRSHEFNDKVKTAVGQIYPFEHAANIYLQNIDVSKDALDKFLIPLTPQEQVIEQTQANSKKNKKKGKQAKGIKIKDVVFKLIPCLFPLVIEHILLSKGIDPQLKIDNEESRGRALQASEVSLQFLKQFLGRNQEGILYTKGEEYFQFSPFKNVKYNEWPSKNLGSFNAAVQQYFLKYKKNQHQEEQQFEEIAWRKYQQIKKDQDERVLKLQEQQQLYKLKAELIQKNVQDVDAVIKIVKTLEDNGFSWDVIDQMVLESKKNGDPLGNMIHSLNILKRQITILLGEPGVEAQLSPLVLVELNIDYNAYTNATLYYQGKKKQQQKEQRTKEASEQVLKIAEKDALKKIEKKKNQILSKAVPSRKPFWFQKFYWFVTSQGFLVISGRDSHQNQLLVKRYMKVGDLYMHSDYGGAASTVIKRRDKSLPVPRNSLEEAAAFTVCRSKAWDTKIISGAWWVYHDQVSKSAPTGEFLPTGSFMIRGKRNYINPNRMEMGLTLLYKVDQESAQRHLDDRRVLQAEDELIKEDNLRKQQYQDHQNEQYAIVNIQAQTNKAKDKKKNNAENKANNAKNNKIQEVPQIKKQVSTNSNKQEQEEEGEDSDSDDQEQKQKKGVKSGDQKGGSKKDIKKDKKQEPKDPQVKHKNRNKKKIKKLERYLQEQDEDERQIILKMLGAKEMKHMKGEEEEQQIINSKLNIKKQKKRGIDKYITIDKNDDADSLNPDKVLFLKSKGGKDKGEEQRPIEQKPRVQKPKEQKSREQKSRVQKSKEQKSKESKFEQKKQKAVQSIKNQQKIVQNKVEEVKKQIVQVHPPEINEKIQEAQNQKEKLTQNLEKDQQTQGLEEEKIGQDGAERQEEDSQGQDEPEVEQKEEEKKEQQEEVDQKLLDSELGELLKLVGRPHPLDKYEALVPMCAPYNAIKQNRFKVKLVPGGLKKGKAARNIMGYFGTIDLNETEKTFVRAVPEQQVINALIGNVKLAGAGLLKIELKSKAQKKDKRKQQDKKE